ncbi:MAG: lysophospholipid acyltransferase family protein [Ketobacteraceae bacterium]|nr:lysophospholipid acyltransferase family protein [Ketobacteraceae bacterium]
MRLIKGFLVFIHILLGLALLVITGALWRPLSPQVKTTKRWWLGRILKLMAVDTEVCGELPQHSSGKGRIYVSNHVSWLDIPLIGSLRELNFLSKAEVKRWPLIGKLAESTGTLFIQRGSGDSEKIKKDISQRIEQGHSVLFFPEGTTTDGSSLRKFHYKLFQVNQHIDVEFCPVVIHYEVDGEYFNPVAFIDDDEFAEHLWHLLGFAHIRARVEFLPARKLSVSNLRADVLRLEEEMRRKVELRSGRIRQPAAASPEKPAAASA